MPDRMNQQELPDVLASHDGRSESAQAGTAQLTPPGQTFPTPDELVERARAMTPTLLERASSTEQARRLPDETVQEFKDAGFVKMGAPTRFGGYGYGLDTIVEVTQPIGRACGSSAWLCTFFPVHQMMVAWWWSEEAQVEYWADGPNTIGATASALVQWEATPVAGGIRATGRHRFSSGVDHADWVLLFSPKEAYLIPRADITIEDDWFVSGLKGTGSKTISFENIFIPQHRIVSEEQLETSLYPGRELYPDNPWYEFHKPRGLVDAQAILAPVIAMAGGVVEMFDERVRTRRDTLTMEPAVERAIVQHRFAESAMEHDLALMLLRQNVRELRDNPNPTPLDRARIRRNTTYANHLCHTLVDRLITSGDASAIYEKRSHVHRLARDVHAATLHLALGWDETAIQYSRVRWGLSPNTILS